MRVLVVLVLLAVLIPGCVSKNRVQPVTVINQDDEAMTCEAIRAETQRNYARMLRVDENIDGTDGRNATLIAAFVVGALLVGPGSLPTLDNASSDKDLLLDYARRNKRLDAFAEQKDCPPLPPLPPEIAEALEELGARTTADAGEANPEAAPEPGSDAKPEAGPLAGE